MTGELTSPQRAAHDEPPLSPVWTRRPPVWKRALRAALASVGSFTPMGYFYFVRRGALSWNELLAIDVGVALVTGIVAAGTLGDVRTRLRSNFTAMLDSTALLPWMAGAFVTGLAGLMAGLSWTRSGVLGLAAASGAVALWSWGCTAWWLRRRRELSNVDALSDRNLRAPECSSRSPR